MALTEQGIKSLKPKAYAYPKFDKRRDGFGVRVLPSGKKYFILKYTWKGKPRFLKLGDYPGLSLADARDKVRDIRQELLEGVEPRYKRQQEQNAQEQASIKAEQKRREAARQGDLEQLFDVYVNHLKLQGKESWKEVQRTFNADIGPVLGKETKAKEINPAAIRRCIQKVVKRGAIRQSSQVRTNLHAAFQYGIEFDLNPDNLEDIQFGIQYNPVTPVKRPRGSNNVRDRELSHDEIRKLWWILTTGNMHPYTALSIKLILTTGQRVQEVTSAAWDEFDIDSRLWTIPGARTKNGRPHVVPLPEIAVSLLKRIWLVSDGSDLLFHKKASKKEANLDKPMPYGTLSLAVTRLCAEHGLTQFQPRDLRRTWKTRTGEIGISKEIRDRIQNHALDDVASKHYDRYDYLAEKRVAMEQWNKNLIDALRGRKIKANIVSIRQTG